MPILAGAQRARGALPHRPRGTDDRAPVFTTVRAGCAPPTAATRERQGARSIRAWSAGSSAATPSAPGYRRDIRLHDLRHTAITGAIAQGESILLVSAFAGHAKASTTLDVYAHLMPTRVAEAARRMRSLSPATFPPQAEQPRPTRAAAACPSRPAPRWTPAPAPPRQRRAKAKLRLDFGAPAAGVSWSDLVGSHT